MKIFIMVLMFVIIFFVLQNIAAPWFFEHTGIQLLFSLTISAVLVMTGFGIMDTLKSDRKD